MFSLATLVLGGCGGRGHKHEYEFASFIWTQTPGAYTAVARYVCEKDGEYQDYDATVTKTGEVLPTCTEGGSNTWHAYYEGHEEDVTENVGDLGGHQWGEPVWNWTGLTYTVVTATFTCLKNADHTHVETTAAQLIDSREPNCTQNGFKQYRATVTFNGQNYSDERTDNIPALDHELSGAGFCDVCGEYGGETIDDPDMNTLIQNFPAGAILYYRFLFDEDYNYKLVFTGGLSESNFQFCGLRSDDWQLINIGNDWTHINATDDDYVYLVLTLSSPINYATFRIDSQCAHNHLDAHGFCTNCGEYQGFTITQEQWNTDVTLPDTEEGGTLYVRAKVDEQHHFTLVTPENNWVQALDSEEYYLKNGDNFRQISSSDFLGLDSAAANKRTSEKYFFTEDTLGGQPYDGYLYMVFTCGGQDALTSEVLRVSTACSGWYSDYGFCHTGDGHYCGWELSLNHTQTGLAAATGVKTYLRFPNTTDQVKLTLTNINPSYVKVYYVNYEGNFALETLEDTFTPITQSEDGYHYIVITATASFASGSVRVSTPADEPPGWDGNLG